MSRTWRARILVLSDAAAAGRREDLSGPALRAKLESAGWSIVASEILPDDLDRIVERLKTWTNGDDCDLVLTTGGTGLGPRDVTPEATRAVIEREVPGLAEWMRVEGAKQTRRALLSRGVVGIRRGKLILNLPGSVRGATESLEAILDLLPHALDIVQGRTAHPEPE